jgi:hypothetical protein
MTRKKKHTAEQVANLRCDATAAGERTIHRTTTAVRVVSVAAEPSDLRDARCAPRDPCSRASRRPAAVP